MGSRRGAEGRATGKGLSALWPSRRAHKRNVIAHNTDENTIPGGLNKESTA